MTEEFREYKDGIEVSNIGNVKRNGVLLKPFMGDYYYCISVEGKPERVHVIVGKLFPEVCGDYKDGYHYHHINHNQLDNRAENIICLSASEHQRLHHIEDSIRVKAYDKNGNFIGRWNSKHQAAEATGIDYRHISEITTGNTNRFTAGKLFWFLDEVPEEEVKGIIADRKNNKQGRRKKVNLYERFYFWHDFRSDES